MGDVHYDGINKLRMWVYDDAQIVDIYDYYFNDLKDNEFKSKYLERNYCVDDALYFILPTETFKDIFNQAYEKGLMDGKKSKNKIKTSTDEVVKAIEEITEQI
jgi:hypothetical protein